MTSRPKRLGLRIDCSPRHSGLGVRATRSLQRQELCHHYLPLGRHFGRTRVRAYYKGGAGSQAPRLLSGTFSLCGSNDADQMNVGPSSLPL